MTVSPLLRLDIERDDQDGQREPEQAAIVVRRSAQSIAVGGRDSPLAVSVDDGLVDLIFGIGAAGRHVPLDPSLSTGNAP